MIKYGVRKTRISYGKVRCKRCGYEWEPRVPSPKCCTNCKQYDYKDKK